MSKFKLFTSFNNGFHMTFENGWTVSVQWGKGNYITKSKRVVDEMGVQSMDAEVAAWDKYGKNFIFPDEFDAVKGFMTADEVADFIHLIKSKEA